MWYAALKLGSKSIAFLKQLIASSYLLISMYTVPRAGQTGFHQRTSALTKDMMDSSGYRIPNKYNNYGAIKEYTACRS